MRSKNDVAMPRGMIMLRSLLAMTVLACCCTQVFADARKSAGERIFALKVKPLLERKCFACHGRDKQKLAGKLDLTTRQTMLRGGESYPKEVLVPGKSAISMLYRSVRRKDDELVMPPKEADKLTDDEVQAIKDWISLGAPWPAEKQIATIRRRFAKGVVVKTTKPLSKEWSERRYLPEDLWAYQSLKTPAVPKTGDAHPVDAFLSAARKSKLKPAPRADRGTLIRRATYDLTGLPPTPKEVAEFLNDASDDAIAFRKVIDRLQKSKHYGEQYGRHWLDVVRYADSAGFANDFERPNAWRYRDYVIRSFNGDKPFDQFVKEQLAGDEIDAKNTENLIAVGFLRMGPWEQTGMSVAKITRQQFLDDITDAVGQVFLSHPLQCARCHDHKFDPIPTRDYYRIQAVFATTQFADRNAPFLKTENSKSGFDGQKYLRQRISHYQGELRKLNQKNLAAEKKWYADRNLKWEPRGRLLKRGVAADKIAPRHLGFTPEDFGRERIGRKMLARHQWEFDRYKPIAFSAYSGKSKPLRNVRGRIAMPAKPNAQGKIEQTSILSGGDVFSPKDNVVPGVLSALPGSNDTIKRTPFNSIPRTVSGRRMAFANWVADSRNPLTARSIVNRVWLWHFGVPLAGNPNNFGATGKKPTHPKLLDFLASWFIEKGWSIKKLNRFLMTSHAYAMDSRHPFPQTTAGEPYLAFRPRRLSAEEIRDGMLLASGELNPTVGGLPVFPHINQEAALQPRMIMGTYAPAYQPSPKPADRNRRSIYAVRVRGLRDPFLEVFNQPNLDKCSEKRDTSTITPQVFSLLNSRISYERALAFANRITKETKSEESAIERVYQLAYSRKPTAEEKQLCLSHWQSMTKKHAKTQIAPRVVPRSITRTVVDENTGKTFKYTEILEQATDYVPDLQPNQVSAAVRGLADVCLVILNANEFVTID